MTTKLDLTDAAMAAAEVRYREQEEPTTGVAWADVSEALVLSYLADVRDEVAAAAPLIERQVRERIAADIEAQTVTGYEDGTNAYEHAARIARGES